jgi:flavin reductase (DIM6/NTAB) family NADH-FMN oxidoreductase RutF
VTHPQGEALRATMRRWASGVTVVTARDGERRAGMTVSAFLSVSLEPPTILVSLNEGSEPLRLLRGSKAFAVSILPAGAEAASARFAGYGIPPDADRFEGSATRVVETGAQVL